MKRVRFVALAVFIACAPTSEEVASEGTRPNPLTGPGSATHPAVSPDGTVVAFMSNMVGVVTDAPINFEIYLSDSRGKETVRLTENEAFDADIAWSPDGQKIAYKSYQDGNDEIYIVGRDGSGRRNLTAHPGSDFQPHWSPSGDRIAFGSDRGGTAGIYLLDLLSGRVEVLLDSEESESSPRWSPDGRRMAFVSGRGGDDNIYVMNSDGTDIRQLTWGPDSDWSPRWSPDGSRLLFISGSFDDDQWALYSLNVQGISDPVLIVDGVDSGNAAWHPTEDRIYFGRYVDGESRLFSARSDGSQVSPFGTR